MKPHRAWLRRWLPSSFLRKVTNISHVEERFLDAETRRAQLARVVLGNRYPGLFADSPTDEFQVFSQNGEDGILLRVLTQLDQFPKTFAEIGIEDGLECNTAILGFVLGWDGLMVEGEALRAGVARRLVARMLRGRANRIEVRHQFVNAENVSTIVGSDPLGVLSVDVDGNDYWLWRALKCPQAHVVVIEYNASFGPERCITVPYDPQFSALRAHPSGYYHGASLPALEKLGRAKGYSLVAVDASGVNAFFVLDAVRPASLPSRSAAEIFVPHRMRLRRHSEKEQWDIVRHLQYEAV